MKKHLLTYLVILVGIFIFLSILGINSDYAVERKSWKVQKEYFDIVKDPKVVPEKTFEKVIREFEQIIKQHPNSKLVSGMRFLVGHVYFLKKDYTTARQKFNEVIKLYPNNDEIHAESLAAIARTHEAEKDWPRAQKIYTNIMSDLPKTQVGMGTPLYIANHYKTANDYQKTMDAYERAITHYAQLAANNTNSSTEYNALRFLSNCYLEQKRWKESVETLGKVINKYGEEKYMNPYTADTIIKTINAVSIYQLKDYDLPIEIYTNIIKKDPDHSLNKHFRKMIESLNTLKAKSVRITPAK